MEHVAWGNCSTETDGSGKKSASKIVKSLRGRWVQPCYSLHFGPAAIFLHPHLSSRCYFHCCCSQSRCSLPAGPRCGLLLPLLLPLLPLSLAASVQPLSSPAPHGSSCGHCGSSPCRTPWGNTYVSAGLLQPHFLHEFSQRVFYSSSLKFASFSTGTHTGIATKPYSKHRFWLDEVLAGGAEHPQPTRFVP